MRLWRATTTAEVSLSRVAVRASAVLLLAAGIASPCNARTQAPSAPPAPQYAQADTWAAWPGRASSADSVAPGLPDASVPDDAKVDVFFIHPTTYLTGIEPNARFDEPGLTSSRIDDDVLRFQASVFNACCRIYAPHYRQATISAFLTGDDAQAIAAFELAYADVLRAFDYYLQHENHGRAFIIASHSQGSLHAMRLLQERIARRPLQQQLVVAYAIGYDIPEDIERTGVPVCRSAPQTGCLVDWNTVKEGISDSTRVSHHLIWLDERYQHIDGRSLVCVNPLNWELGGTAAAQLNLGALPTVRASEALLPPVPQLTGASCEAGLLRVSIPLRQRHGFSNVMTLAGSYHVFDYSLFYTNIRMNVRERISAFRAQAAAPTHQRDAHL
ncbi:MAG: DUF3089 domain-containing protein [Steroidobacteraceae bacterium]